MKLQTLTADIWRMDGGIAFGVVPKSIWSRLVDSDENNTVKLITRCLLIQYGTKTILVDAGLGNKRGQKYYDVRYRDSEVDIFKSLNTIGLNPEDITDIIFTHLHDDHVGAATHINNDVLCCTFPNANYWISESHWQWALNPNKRESAAFFADNFLPLQQSGRLKLWDEVSQPFDNIELRVYNGHTHGQIIPLIRYKNRIIVYMADFIPTSYNIAMPYIPSVDVEPLLTLTEKEVFLEEALNEDYILFFEHDFEHECCSLKKTEKGININKTFNINELDLIA